MKNEKFPITPFVSSIDTGQPPISYLKQLHNTSIEKKAKTSFVPQEMKEVSTLKNISIYK